MAGWSLPPSPARSHGGASAPLGPAGIYEYFFEVDDAEPGGGRVSGRRGGRALMPDRFPRDKMSGRTCFLLLPGGVANLDERRPRFRSPGGPLLRSAAASSAWCSERGWPGPGPAETERWSLLPEGSVRGGGPCRAADRPVLFSGQAAASDQVAERERSPAGRAGIAGAGRIRRRPAAAAETDDASSWLQQLDAIRPAVDRAGMARASIIRFLAGCRNANLGQPLLHGLLDDMLDEPLPWEARCGCCSRPG